MLQLKPLPPRTDRQQMRSAPLVPRQQRTMVIALILLVGALVFVLYRDREFWFAGVQEAEDQLPPSAPVEAQPSQPAHKLVARRQKPKARYRQRKNSHAAAISSAEPVAASSTEPVTISNRTVLPPLEVEVVAGDSHQVAHPRADSVHVELQTGSSSIPAMAPALADNQTAADVTTNAAERVQISADTADVVSHAVQPGYPMLARQMKVQGSVVLQALISRDGHIQDLRVLGGPPILASAAQEAVRKWHFKPHFAEGEAVETQARITVNFTISTN